MIVELVKQFREMIAYIHSKQILVVDLNELNFLVSKKFNSLYAIDVNSYQTPSFPATAIMEHIRDRHCKLINNLYQFNEGTDWFAWAIVTCQMFLGIHPYKGGHPKFEKMPVDERLDSRMKANVSIFNDKATVPAACQAFDVIPPTLKQWYIAVLEKGWREAPPKDFFAIAAQIVTKIKEIMGSNLFDITEIAKFQQDILDVWSCGGLRLVLTTDKAFLNNKEVSVTKGSVIGFSPKMNRPVAAYLDGESIKLFDISNQKDISFTCNATALMTSGHRLYAQAGTSVLEIKLVDIGNNIIATADKVGNILDIAGAAHVFDGVILQNLLGKWYASLFPSSGQCYQIKLDELDSHEIVEAFYENYVLIIVAIHRKTGKYDRFVFRFDENFATHDYRKIENVTYLGLNVAVGDQGICLLIDESEKLETFTNKVNSGVQVLGDPVIASDMKLYHEDNKMLFIKGNKLYSITKKKKS
jgi:hypothetical protein